MNPKNLLSFRGLLQGCRRKIVAVKKTEEGILDLPQAEIEGEELAKRQAFLLLER